MRDQLEKECILSRSRARVAEKVVHRERRLENKLLGALARCKESENVINQLKYVLLYLLLLKF